MPFLEGFLSMKRLGEAAGILGRCQDASCPQAHVTHFTIQGATLRLLIREPEHRYPEAIEAMLRQAESGTAMELLATVKENLDPWGVFPALEDPNPSRRG